MDSLIGWLAGVGYYMVIPLIISFGIAIMFVALARGKWR